jgi:hypothetical protein
MDDRLFAACALAWGAGLLNGLAALDRHPAFFALAAAAQLGWGVAAYRSPARGVLAAGVVLNASLALAWMLWQPSAIGGLDSLAAVDEIAIAAVAPWVLRARRSGPVARAGRTAALGIAVYLVLASGVALAAGQTRTGVAKPLVGVPRAGLELLCHPG